ncbi:unnamed protein product [Clonostachys chloroleuca]|uniref:Uncharacterized protein n=1 Tax=Clonostachys chloroleuca TaxID=1926264 RepID=A0AA35QA07_9HYPO|nr:unnamed protein product [Clonostachys chloroleuca]
MISLLKNRSTVTISPKIRCLHDLDKDNDAPIDGGPQQKTRRKGAKKPRKEPVSEGNVIARKIVAVFRKKLPIAFNVDIFSDASQWASYLLSSLSGVLHSFQQGYLTYGDLRQKFMETFETVHERAVIKSVIRHLIICLGICLNEDLGSEGKAVEHKHQLGALLKEQGLSDETCLAALGGLSATDFKFRNLNKSSEKTATYALQMAASEMASILRPYESRQALWVLNPGRFLYWFFGGRPPAFPRPKLWSMQWPNPKIVGIQYQLYPGTKTTTGQPNAESEEMETDISDGMSRKPSVIGKDHEQQFVMVDHRVGIDSTFSSQRLDTAHSDSLDHPESIMSEGGLFMGFYMDDVFPDAWRFIQPL